MDECKPLMAGETVIQQRDMSRELIFVRTGRGSHSTTFRLTISAFCGIGGAFRGCLGGV